MKSVLNFVFLFLVFMTTLNSTVHAATGDRLKYLPVQDGGRVKPFDSFARETLELLYGRSTFKRPTGNQSEPAYLIVMSFLLSPESWVEVPLFEVNNLEIKKYLGLNAEEKHFKGNDLFKGEKFANLIQQLNDRREAKEKLNPYFQAVQRLENQFYTFRELTAGRYIKVMPVEGSDSWLGVSALPSAQQSLFVALSQNLARYLGEMGQSGAKSEATLKAGKELDSSVDQFISSVQTVTSNKISAEVFYNDAHLFRWVYIFYLLAALILLYIWIRNSSLNMNIVWVITWIGFLLHMTGFAFRVYLAERPPVTNMYETVVWVSWGAVLFSMILEKIYKYKSILLAGLLVGVFSMVVADMAPAILDPSIQPLEAVLRSNYWLIIHVMTITISYAAFFLAFGLGDLGLVYYVIDAQKYREQIKNISTAVYRAMQIGVAFLAPGIILGGVWADYSWGRFWGWDPKETWALIVLLGYIIVLHARLVNWLQNFGMLVAGVITFNLVIMAWYGVNFVLGAGLHSYGFGAGGIEYVLIFTLAHVLFLAYAAVVRKTQEKTI
ncbi:MAG: cytochrome c biogenesis protein CcsA [Moraxellaceae bacterium]|nr:cytochrome c biogenesis protein CcsA [Pseudobdellovibrionaceae bacterium]